MILAWRQTGDAAASPIEGLWIASNNRSTVEVGWQEGAEPIRVELAFSGEPLRAIERSATTRTVDSRTP